MHDNLDQIPAWREMCTVTRNLTLHYHRMMLILQPTPLTRAPARQVVEVVNYPDGRFAVQHDGVALPFAVFDKIRTLDPRSIIENKRLTEVLAQIQAHQAGLSAVSASLRSRVAAATETIWRRPDSPRRGARHERPQPRL